MKTGKALAGYAHRSSGPRRKKQCEPQIPCKHPENAVPQVSSHNSSSGVGPLLASKHDKIRGIIKYIFVACLSKIYDRFVSARPFGTRLWTCAHRILYSCARCSQTAGLQFSCTAASPQMPRVAIAMFTKARYPADHLNLACVALTCLHLT